MPGESKCGRRQRRAGITAGGGCVAPGGAGHGSGSAEGASSVSELGRAGQAGGIVCHSVALVACMRRLLGCRLWQGGCRPIVEPECLRKSISALSLRHKLVMPVRFHMSVPMLALFLHPRPLASTCLKTSYLALRIYNVLPAFLLALFPLSVSCFPFPILLQLLPLQAVARAAQAASGSGGAATAAVAAAHSPGISGLGLPSLPELARMEVALVSGPLDVSALYNDVAQPLRAWDLCLRLLDSSMSASGVPGAGETASAGADGI
jgi:hypothetical protein